MEKIRFFILFYLFSSILISCDSNNNDLIFDFNNSQLQHDGWVVTKNSEMRIDSTETVNGKYPLVIEQTKCPTEEHLVFNALHYLPLSVMFYRQILLPDLLKNTDITISISNKSLNLSEALLRFFCIDKEDNIIFCDSIHLNNENAWNTKSTSFPANQTHRIILGISVIGYGLPSPNAYNPQKLWLDKITLRAHGTALKSDNQQLAMPEEIDPGYSVETVFPLDQWSKINIPDDKTIIGIGEAVHGSKTINQIEMELVKNLILYHSCKLVLFELDMFQLMIWNQFVLGKIPDDYIYEIKKEASLALFSPEIVADFLIWLKKYNNVSNEKVYIQGLDQQDSWENRLFHYLYAFYNDSTASTLTPLLEKLNRRTFSEALIQAQESKLSLETIMGNKEFENFLYALEKVVGYNKAGEILIKALGNNVDSISEDSLSVLKHRFLDRDIAMTESVNRFIPLYLQNNQKACIIAHNGHINKKLSFNIFLHPYPMGYYLRQKYGDKYYSLGIFSGEGSISVLSDSVLKFQEVYLNPVSPHSLEYACLQTGLATFFYPTKQLENNLFYYRSIGNQYAAEEYSYGNLKTQLDGFIFVDKIYPIRTGSYNIEAGTIILEKMKREIEILRTVQNSP